jgi:hypothetical protein
VGLTLAAAALLAGAAMVWLGAPDAARTTTTRRTVDIRIAPASKHKLSLARRKSKHVVMVTVTRIDGTAKKGGRFQAPSATGRRSETLTLSVIGVAAVLLVLAAGGRLPAKLGLGGASVEWVPRQVAVAATGAALKQDLPAETPDDKRQDLAAKIVRGVQTLAQQQSLAQQRRAILRRKAARAPKPMADRPSFPLIDLGPADEVAQQVLNEDVSQPPDDGG